MNKMGKKVSSVTSIKPSDSYGLKLNSNKVNRVKKPKPLLKSKSLSFTKKIEDLFPLNTFVEIIIEEKECKQNRYDGLAILSKPDIILGDSQHQIQYYLIICSTLELQQIHFNIPINGEHMNVSNGCIDLSQLCTLNCIKKYAIILQKSKTNLAKALKWIDSIIHL